MDGRLAYRAVRLPGAPPAVLVHGLGVSSAYFRPLIRELSGRADVLAPDLPGFGRSPAGGVALTIPQLAEALGAFIAGHRLGRPVLVANSMGCQVAVDVAVRRPELVAALALVGPTVDPAGRDLPRQLARLAVDATREHPFALVAIGLDYARAGPLRVLGTARHMLADAIEAMLPFVSQPTLVIRGARDAIAPAAWCEAVARALPSGGLVTIPGAAHAAHWSHPAPTAEAIAPLLALGLPGTPPPPR